MTNENVTKIPIVQQALIINAVSNGMVQIITSVYLKVTGSRKTQTCWIHGTKLHGKLEAIYCLCIFYSDKYTYTKQQKLELKVK